MSSIFRNERGSLFVVSIWAITMLVFFVSTIFVSVSQKVSAVKRFRQEMEVHHMTLSSLAYAKAAILADQPEEEDEKNKYDAYTDTWSAGGVDYFQNEIQIGKGTFRIGHLDLDSEKDDEVILGLQDEASKININKASEKILRSFFENAMELPEDESAELTASVIDWRDTNEAVHLGGAESEYYEDLPEPYTAKNADFERIEELLFLKGMDDTLYRRMADLVTVHTDGKINMNTASGPVLKALGADQSLVDKIIKFRKGSDGVYGTEDDGVFERPEDVLTKITQELALETSETQQLSQIVGTGLIVVKSDLFTAHIRAQLGNRQELTKITLDREGNVIGWREV